ncbi:hypothetical protein B0H14DRAFT_3427719 [Mycena olivaceomarginata]|nr:hypothetical protein B0H14DRAFT_3427719 [Mycena olivaceomarginata]
MKEMVNRLMVPLWGLINLLLVRPAHLEMEMAEVVVAALAVVPLAGLLVVDSLVDLPVVDPLAVPPEDPLEQLLLATFGALKDALTRYTAAEASPHSNRSLLPNPDTFIGSDPGKLQSFLTQCYLHFVEHGQDFRQDDDRILYIMSYLWRSAQQWFEPNLYNQNPGPPPA